ncbi:hypothetical protein GCM10009634_51970 [Saccharothrix xinjiangensis]
MRVTGKQLRVNVMSAVASRGALWFTVFAERFTAPVFTTFLDRLAHETRRFLRHRQRQPRIVRGYFRAPHLRYAIV